MQRNGWGYGWSWKVVLTNKFCFCNRLMPTSSYWILRGWGKKKKKKIETWYEVSTGWFIFFSCSQYYTRFKSYCCEAYNILRKSSNLILNLFHLMAGSNIPDIASDPEKGILKVWRLIFILWFLILWFFFFFPRSPDSWLGMYWCHVAPREVPVGLGRWSLYSFLPGSNQRKC